MKVGTNGKRIFTEDEVLGAAKELADKEMAERNDTSGNVLWVVVHTLFHGRLVVEQAVLDDCSTKSRELVIRKNPEGGLMVEALSSDPALYDLSEG